MRGREVGREREGDEGWRKREKERDRGRRGEEMRSPFEAVLGLHSCSPPWPSDEGFRDLYSGTLSPRLSQRGKLLEEGGFSHSITDKIRK